MGKTGRIAFEITDAGDYVASGVQETWFSEEEYKEYLRQQPKLKNDAAHDPETSFFTAMKGALGEFNEKSYDGKSLNDIIRDLP